METRKGSCRCGAVTFDVRNDPKRVGLCHCTDCRKESGSAFTTFAVWNRSDFSCTGAVSTYEGRSFCPACGAPVFALADDEAEIKLGSLDAAPFGIRPEYELWVKRREEWVRPIPGCQQFDEDRV